METRLTRGEYWLLETVVTSYSPLCFLDAEGYAPPSSIESMYNKPGHGLSREALLDTLVRLHDDGLICFRPSGSDDFLPLTRDDISEAARDPRRGRSEQCLVYGLTALGGETWEAFARPNWDRFILIDWEHEQRSEHLTCANELRIHQYLRGLDTVVYDVDVSSVRVTAIGEWDATYWRKLPQGYQAKVSWVAERPQSGMLERFAFAGFCEMRDRWYRWM